jgi:predicted GNAT family N-acyltransferase
MRNDESTPPAQALWYEAIHSFFIPLRRFFGSFTPSPLAFLPLTAHLAHQKLNNAEVMGTVIVEIVPSETWHLRHTVMWPDRDIDYVKLPEDDHGIHYGLFQNDQLLSVVSLFLEKGGTEAQFRKFATATDRQGKGHGTTVLKHLISEARQKGIKKLWCNARVDKSGYYQRFGLETTRQVFCKGGIDYVIMEAIL